MTVIEGDSGLIVIDPLISAEVARAGARALLRASAEQAGRRGDLHPQPHRPLRRRARRDRRGRRQGGQGRGHRARRLHGGGRRARTCWPARRWCAARSSSSAPCCRAAPRGQVDAGLGKGIARGTPGLIPPTTSIEQPVETHTIDGVRDRLPARARDRGAGRDAHVLSRLGVLNMAENAARTCTTSSRSAARRCAIRASGRSTSATRSRCSRRTAEVLSPSITGRSGAARRCSTISRRSATSTSTCTTRPCAHEPRLQAGRDRRGLALPPGLAERWHVRGYYGTLSHNAKAVYQRYLGWYDANPAISIRCRRRGGAQVRRVHGRRGGGDRARRATSPRASTAGSPR